ncbi:MAG TPA: fumarylacetoacetate hydrolase family protein [Candidatus Acidoferrales bacterium]|jgi:2-keto-4-pentenoate hydratase/2-oxohepta-3-ene-1,7-dioic acid hydratase in catechol pathway|nr:fumarylacetoacetate hydrolase family protein [Candidatus Acidoferrales bacterium]
MKLCRFQPLEFAIKDLGRSGNEVQAQTLSGILEGGSVYEIRGGFMGARERTGRKWPADQVKYLPPSAPTKIVAVGRNYQEHVKEFNNPLPKEPAIFLKPPSSVLAPDDPIVLPVLSQRVEYEGELAVVMAKRCFHVSQDDDVKPLILGYTALNDVTARDLQRADLQWTRGKGFDTFCPFGPVLETEHPTSATKVETLLNGEVKQSATVGDMIFPIEVIIRWITAVMTLEPGDVIATGTPGGVGPIAAGDIVEVSVSGIATLRNPVAAA